MKIIDAHIHFYDTPYFAEIARQAGHENTLEHLREAFRENGVVHAVVMGNRNLELSEHVYPGYMSYCIGLDPASFQAENAQETADRVEAHLKRENCVGIKLYPGYNPYYVSDPLYHPFYELAGAYKKPVAIHTGATARSDAFLKYSHPLTLDDIAPLFPEVQFVMCHLGNPWIVDAAAVISKNHNVCADLSGILEGKLDMPAFLADSDGYIQHIRTWLSYIGDYSRFLYGTDWPLANISNYIEFVANLVPEKHYDAVFFHNANRVYNLKCK